MFLDREALFGSLDLSWYLLYKCNIFMSMPPCRLDLEKLAQLPPATNMHFSVTSEFREDEKWIKLKNMARNNRKTSSCHEVAMKLK